MSILGRGRPAKPRPKTGVWLWGETELRLVRQMMRLLEVHEPEVRERVLDNLQKWHLRQKMREQQAAVAREEP